MWQEILNIIRQANSFILTTHINPDGDGIGSAYALTELLKAMGKQVKFVCDSLIPEKFRFLDFQNTSCVFKNIEELLPYDVFIVLDANKKERIGKVSELLNHAAITSICIDHHPTEYFFTKHAAIDPCACSVGAMIYTLYKESGFELNLSAAMGIYVSVISDTGRFSYASTSRKAHELADECIKVGVDPSVMHSYLYRQTSIDYIKIFANIVKNIEFFFDGKLLVQQIRYEDYAEYQFAEAHLHDLDFIHEFNKTIKGVECAAILFEFAEKKHVRVSLRSNMGIDIVQPMRQMGGGGHPSAAGALVYGTFEEVKTSLISLLKPMLY